MKEIELTQGYVALVDDEDYEKVNKYLWQAFSSGNTIYANGLTGKKRMYMHRFIMSLVSTDKETVDHIDHDGLNNQKINLRVCTRSDNMKNKLSAKNSSSRYKGISWNKRDKVWAVEIKSDYKRYYLGVFNCELKAAKTYNEAALKYHGKFAKLNIMPKEKL